MLRLVPDLKLAPSEVLTASPDFDDTTARTITEETSIPSIDKLQSIYKLRDEVYRTRCVRLHWSMASILETAKLPNQSINTGSEFMEESNTFCDIQNATQPVRNSRYNYDLIGLSLY